MFDGVGPVRYFTRISTFPLPNINSLNMSIHVSLAKCLLAETAAKMALN